MPPPIPEAAMSTPDIPTSLLITAAEPDQVSLLVADLAHLYGTRVRVTSRFTESSDPAAPSLHCAAVEIVGRDPWLPSLSGAAA
ncbi:hypothetical protein [Nitrospirillum bahiense]|nr:hypothetical protein [Nitrospirillum amazonense]